MADDQIVQEVVLQGTDDIKAQFESLEQAGLKLFSSLKAASAGAAFETIGLALAGAAAGFASIATTLFKFAEGAAESTHELSSLATQAGTTIEDVTTLVGSFSESTGQMTSAFRRMAVTIQSEWPQIVRAQRNATSVMIADNLSVQGSYLALERAQIAAANAAKVNADLQVKNANSVKGATLSLAEAQEALRVLRGGEVNPALAQELAEKKAILAVENARLALAEARRKAEEDEILQQNAIAEAQLKAQQTALALAESLKKQIENRRNDINNLAKVVDDLSKGITTSLSTVDLNAGNLVKGLIASLGSSGEALQAFGGNITSVASAPPILKDALFKLSAVFHNITDDALKMSASVKFFGRTVSQDLIDELSQGPEVIKANQERLAALGFTISSVDELIAKKFRLSLIGLNKDLATIKTQSGNVFDDGFTRVVTAITNIVEKNRSSFVALAQAINDTVMPAVLGFVQAITGNDLTEGLSDSAKKSVEIWAGAFASIKLIAQIGFAAVVGIAQAAAGVLNLIFGKDTFSALDVALGLVLIKFGGLLGLTIALGIALDKITNGGVSQYLAELGVLAQGAGKMFSNAIELLKTWDVSAFANKNSLILLKMGEDIDKIRKSAAQGKVSIEESARKATEAAIKAATDATKKFKDDTDKALGDGTKDAADKAKTNFDGIKTGLTDPKAALQQINDLIAKLGPNAVNQLPQLKQLQDQIKLLGPGQGSKGIQQIDMNEPFVKPPIPSGAATSPFTGPQGIQTQAAKVLDVSNSLGEVLKKNIQLWQDFNDVKPAPALEVDKTKVDALAQEMEGLNNLEIKPKITLTDLILPKELARESNAISGFVKDLFGELSGQNTAIAEAVKKVFVAATDELSAENTGIANAFKRLFSGKNIEPVEVPKSVFVDTITKGLDAASDLFKNWITAEKVETPLKDSLANVKPTIVAPFAEAVDPIKAEIDKIAAAYLLVPGKVEESLIDVPTKISTPFVQGGEAAMRGLDPLEQRIDRLIQKLQELSSGAGAAEERGAPPFASGGQFFGKPGIDTNLAWLTHREFVQPVRAVEKFGVGFMEMVRHLDVQGIVQWAQRYAMPKFNAGGVVDWTSSAYRAPSFDAHGRVDWANRSDVPRFQAGGLVDWLNRFSIPGFNAGGLVDWVSHVVIPAFKGRGVVDWGHQVQAAPAFNAGGLVSWADKNPVLTRLLPDAPPLAPDRRASGTVEWMHALASIPKYSTGGLVSWDGARPAMAGVSVPGVVDWFSRFDLPKFASGGLVQWLNSVTMPSIGQVSRALSAPLMIPTFADGGLNSWSAAAVNAPSRPSVAGVAAASGNQLAGHITVDLRTDRQTIQVLAGPEAARQLSRLAIDEQISSAGPAPSWVARRRN